MFGVATEKFGKLFSGLARKKKLTEDNIAESVREVRLALLDADVNFGVVSRLVKRIKEKALGDEVLKAVDPGDQFIKVVHEELVALMGGVEPRIELKGSPAVILLCGLQGSGKTTTSAKLARYLKGKEFQKMPMIAACDLQRAAAVDQLKILGEQIDVPVFAPEKAKSPVKVAKEALAEAKKQGCDVLIIDSAGRLHVDDTLMKELQDIKKAVDPKEVLFVASAATGQDAVKTASEFDKAVGITGSILTMLDGSARAGSALSILEITGRPLKFEGVGERLDAFQRFNPESMTDRILGMGDVINLVKKAEEHLDEEDGEELEKKLKNATFTYADYLKQMAGIKKMGSMKGLLKMLPGASEMGDLDMSEDEFKKMEAMILSMTKNERACKVDLTPPRRRRVATGSGTTIDDVNRLCKGFKRIKQFFKGMSNPQKKLKKQLGSNAGLLDKFF